MTMSAGAGYGLADFFSILLCFGFAVIQMPVLPV
jgi:hypothetical protein